MAVKYLAGKRIQGTDAERPPATLSSPPSGWEYLGRTTLTSAGDVIDVENLSNKKYYMVLRHIKGGDGNMAVYNRLNGDTGSSYAYRQSENGATDAVTSSAVTSVVYDTGGDANDKFDVTYISNLASKEKLAIGHGINRNSSGSGGKPKMGEFTWKWANTSNAISAINTFNDTNSQSGNFNTGSEVVVLGYDPTDTNTSNFWEQLASVSGDGTSNTLSTGTTIGKKYLWIQAYLETTGQQKGMFRVGNGSVDASGDYAFTISNNGGSDASHDVKNSFTEDMPNALHHFVNIFAINNASSEGLFIGHDVGVVTTGAGNAPIRQEFVGKWANTSNQFNILDVVSGSGDGNWSSNAKLRVWGAD